MNSLNSNDVHCFPQIFLPKLIITTIESWAQLFVKTYGATWGSASHAHTVCKTVRSPVKKRPPGGPGPI